MSDKGGVDMLSELGNDLKNILLAGVGAVAVTAEKSEMLIKELVKKGELTIEQGKALNEELKHKIKEQAQERKEKEFDCMLENMTSEEREELKRKLEELEKSKEREEEQKDMDVQDSSEEQE